MDNSLAESVNFLKDFQWVKLKRGKSWTQRQYENQEAWNEQRTIALESYLEREFVKNSCSKCNNPSPLIFCGDCWSFFCSSCDVDVHSKHTFHNRKALLNGFFKPISPTEYIADDGSIQIGSK